MKSSYLLPHRFKIPGWSLFIVGVFLGILCLLNNKPTFLDIQVFGYGNSDSSLSFQNHLGFFQNNILDELASLLLIVGAIFIVFSKAKIEDEFISKIRLDSLVWAVYVNYIILLLSIIFVYDLAFFTILVFNMFTVLFFFILRFNWILHKTNKIKSDEK